MRHGDLPVDGRNKRSPRRAIVLAHGFELAIASAGVMTAIQFFADISVRSDTAIGALGSPYAWTWIILYLIGSIGILFGLLKPADRLEVAGLCCFGAAALVNGAALLQVRGARGVYVAFIFIAFFFGAVSRIHLLLALRRMPLAGSSKAEG